MNDLSLLSELEEKIRELINKKYSSHGILGEEFEETNIDSEFTWVIDPIDGTMSFIAGHKDFGTLWGDFEMDGDNFSTKITLKSFSNIVK